MFSSMAAHSKAIEENIQRVESSRRTLIVLSSHYVQSMWSNLEFRAAHSKAIEENIQRVVIVLAGELPDLDTMSEDLKMYVRARSYISKTDSWFWRKLRYSLSKKTKSRDKEKLEDLDEAYIDTTPSNVPYY